MRGPAVPLWVLVFACLISPVVSGDHIVTTDGEILECVVLHETSEEVTVMTHQGRRTLEWEEVQDVRRDLPLENLYLLARMYEESSDKERAYYLYQRLLRKDPFDRRVVRALGVLQEDLLASEPAARVRAYQRYTPEAEFSGDIGSLPEVNARATERLYERTGLIFSLREPFVEVMFVEDGSKASRYGIRPGDRLARLDGRDALYLGFYDIVVILAEKPRRITFRRRVALPYQAVDAFHGAGTPGRSVLSVSVSDEGVIVTDVPDMSALAEWGVRPGDTVVQLGGEHMRGRLPEEGFFELLLSLAAEGGFVEMVFAREFVL